MHTIHKRLFQGATGQRKGQRLRQLQAKLLGGETPGGMSMTMTAPTLAGDDASAMPTSAMSTWEAAGASQEDFMQRDMCILVDEADRVTGYANKFDSHRFVAGSPRGLLHRAFSVFLFDSQNRLLLQQRAKHKITFPGNPIGAKRAALRKLAHELGLPPGSLSESQLRYITRLHYCAKDEAMHGPDSPWGEHEMDYILLARTDVHSLVRPNPEEVEDTRWVTLPELRTMMEPASGLSWSPWFLIIAQSFLERWWEDLDKTLLGGLHDDHSTIHRLECVAPATISKPEQE